MTSGTREFRVSGPLFVRIRLQTNEPSDRFSFPPQKTILHCLSPGRHPPPSLLIFIRSFYLFLMMLEGESMPLGTFNPLSPLYRMARHPTLSVIILGLKVDPAPTALRQRGKNLERSNPRNLMCRVIHPFPPLTSQSYSYLSYLSEAGERGPIAAFTST